MARSSGARKRQKARQFGRREAVATKRRTLMLPPARASRRPEYSSEVAGEWERCPDGERTGETPFAKKSKRTVVKRRKPSMGGGR